MKTQKTKVLFLIDKDISDTVKGGVYAYFPDQLYKPEFGSILRTCYTSLTKHSGCLPIYADSCKEATINQYSSLLTELRSIGYSLTVLNGKRGAVDKEPATAAVKHFGISAMVLVILAIAAILLFTSCEPFDTIEPDLKDEPTAINYHATFTKDQPKRVIAIMINSTYHEDRLDAIVLDTIPTHSDTLTIIKPYGKYAYIELKAFAIGHYDKIKVGIDYDLNPDLETWHTNSCDVNFMNIPEIYVAVK